MKNKNEVDLKTSDGTRLTGRKWSDVSNPKAVVVLVHGTGEHVARYEHVAKAFNDRDLALIAFDQKGHGRSKGKRGHIGSPRQVMANITQMIDFAKAAVPDKPVFLYGHSMGGMEVLYYALNEKPAIAGVIVTSPALDRATFTPGQVRLMQMLKHIAPRLTVASGLKRWALSRDPQVIANYEKDKLVHDKVSVSTGYFIYDGIRYIHEHAADWTLPLYLVHGTKDEICPIAGTDAFFEEATGPITYKRWVGLYHETHNEPEKDKILKTMIDWIEDQL